MPNKCCVPSCKSNYKGCPEKVSVFSFPKEEGRMQLWLQKINRDNYSITKHSFVCEKHFEDRFIIREDKIARPNGTVLIVKRQIPRLTRDAFPSIFNGQPFYRTRGPSPKRKLRQRLEEDVKQLRRIESQKYIQEEDALNFNDIKTNFEKKLENLTESTSIQDSCICFYKVDVLSKIPCVIYSIKLYTDLKAEICFQNCIFENGKTKEILGSALICDKWSKLQNLLLYLRILPTLNITKTMC